MDNAEAFHLKFDFYATELWALPEKEFLYWLNNEYKEPTVPAVRKSKSYVLTPPKDTTNIIDTRTTWWDECGSCKTIIQPSWRYCPHCGMKLNWNRNEFK